MGIETIRRGFVFVGLVAVPVACAPVTTVADVASDTATADAASDAPAPHDHGPTDAATDDPTPPDHAMHDAFADALDDANADGDENSPDAVDAAPFDAGPRTVRTLNGCDPTSPMTVDMTGTANPTMLARVDFTFAPACIRIRPGQSVQFRVESPADWSAHPLRAGEVVAGRVVNDPASPIPYVNSGSADLPVRFDAEGSYGFYCTRHYTLGFVGAVHVVP